MRPLYPSRSRSLSRQARTSRSRRVSLECLEGRELLSTITVGDANVTEGDPAVRYFDRFVTSPSGGATDGAYGMAWSPNGQFLYVASWLTDGVFRYDALTGNPAPAPGKSGAEFVSSGSGGLDRPRDIAFGPDGHLYVVSELTSSVLGYDENTGDFLGALVASGTGGIAAPRGLLFNSDGYLYVTSVGTTVPEVGMDSVLRYTSGGVPAGLSGIPGDAVFIASGDHGLDNPSRVVFHNNEFYVASTSSFSNSVMRYQTDGTFHDYFVPKGSGGLSGPVALVFRPDGYLYVTSWVNNQVLRYNGTTGAYVDTAVFAEESGLSKPIDLLFDDSGNFLVSSLGNDQVLRYGSASQAALTVSLSSSSITAVTVDYFTASGTALAGSDFNTVSGTLTFAPGETMKTLLVPTMNDNLSESTKTFTLNLSNPVGATIADGQGVGTILDDDATKFYVVNDASSGDRTYEYGALGASVENYFLDSGNTAPRGAASTAAGDRSWVVDANKKVYVYDNAGALLGSWTAGSLASNATVEGIATDGTDVWIVDARQDKVFRYTGAASRLSGNQNAASSFKLNNGNAVPKDIVTDGTYVWVVNDSTTDTVFKYSLSGKLLGSWAITGAGSSPTGITLDPSGGGTLWIVDNGTDRIYQFDNARSRTSGSQSPTTSFALAAGNTNPQGIADPPMSAVSHVPTPNRLSVSAPKPDQIGAVFPGVVNPAGPRALWSRRAAFRHRHRIELNFNKRS